MDQEEHSRRIRLVRAATQSQAGPVLRQFPLAKARLQNLILGWWGINQVGDPSMPFDWKEKSYSVSQN